MKVLFAEARAKLDGGASHTRWKGKQARTEEEEWVKWMTRVYCYP
jgi:hypothetical protein